MKISVIIPAYNAEKTIGACVNSLLNQKTNGDVEVIAVDDGSSDATLSILSTFERVIFLHQENEGPAAARNAGFKVSSGDIVCFTDADCQAQPGWLATVERYFLQGGVDVLAGSYGISNPKSLLARCVHQEILFRHHRLMGDWVEVFGSYNVSFRREIFERMGGFNTSYRYASGEDNDLSYRLGKEGVRIRFAKDALVDHSHPTRISKYLHEQFRHGFWRAKLYRRHPRMTKGDGYTFLKDILEIPFALGLILLGILVLCGFSWRIFIAVLIAALMVECLFCLHYGIRNLIEVAFFAGIMFLRAFARLFGFALGIF